MAPVTLFDLLGIADGTDLDAAVERWPVHLVQGGPGAREQPDLTEARLLLQFLQGALTFRNVRPGADPDRVGLTAELLVGTAPNPLPLVLAAMPDVEFRLPPNGGEPARVTVTAGDLGTELLIEALAVEIRFPAGLLEPLPPPGSDVPAPEETPIDGFVPGQHDTLRVVLRSHESSSVFVHLKVRMTEEGKFVVEPAVPLSIGPCRFSGLPCRGIHDLNLFPAPMLGVGPGDERHFGDQALEWTRHALVADESPEFGVITVRTVDLDETRPPLSDVHAKLNPSDAPEQRFEWVLEDLAFPIGTGPFPVPSHFLAGLRRDLKVGDDPDGAFNLGGLAIPLEGAARLLRFKYLVIEQLLFRSVPSPALDPPTEDRQFAFVALALVDDPTGAGHGVTLEVTDEWTVLAGWRKQPGLELFSLFGARFLLLGARAGLSLQRLTRGDGIFDSGVLVADIEITRRPKDDGTSPSAGIVKLEGEAKEPKGAVIHDFGLRFGEFAVGGVWKTGGAKLSAFDVISLEIEEFGLVTEPSGAVYFGFSGSIPLPAGRDAGQPVTSAESAGSTGKVEDGVGFRFYRLRGKVAGAEEAPQFLIDGIGLSIRYGKFGISGFGMMSEYVADGHRYKESGLSIELRFPVGQIELILGGLFFQGSVRGPTQNFNYWMVGLHVSPIPIGPVMLTNVRLLFAWNMAPALGAVDAGSATPMRLFQWYKSHSSAVALPANRNMGQGGWAPTDESYTAAVGAVVEIGSRAIGIGAFFVYMSTPAGKVMLAGLEIYFLKSSKPIAYAAVEIEGDRWSVLAGLSLGIENVIGRPVPLLSGVPFLTGTFYHTNKPGTTAIGQFLDPSTWLAVHVGGPQLDENGQPKPAKFDLFTIELFSGICLQIVDLPDGPRVFALRVSVTGGSRLFKVGGIDFYLTLQLVAGVWRTESKVSGFVVWFEGGLDIDVFYVFNWGASVRVECNYLGPEPTQRRLSTEVRIHTPWWLPDVTFRWERSSGSTDMGRMRVVTTPVVDAAAKALAASEPVALPALAPVVGETIDRAAVYGIEEMAGATGAIPAALLAQVATVPVDSSLALHFNASVDDLLVFGQNTTPGIGADASNEVATRYELVELGIRRRPRAGGPWTTLIDAAESRAESLAGLTPEVAAERHRQKLPFRWDADFKREGRPDTRRLLINTDAPYWSAVLDFEGDELLLQSEPGWPCCPPGPRRPRWHTIDFRDVPAGSRVPRTQYFTESRSTLRWVGIAPPIAGPGQAAGGEASVARLNGDTPPEGVFARLAFPEIAGAAELRVRWKPMHLVRALVVRAFRGLVLVEERSFKISQMPPDGIAIASADGISEITLGFAGAAVDEPDVDFGWLEWIELRFRSVGEVLGDLLADGRCGAAPTGSARPGGRFAWLPNHEYEVGFKTRVTVGYTRSGDLVREVPQTLRFRTAGLPGQNRADHVGAEFAPYVESAYPAPGRPLYRSEPVVLALNERSDIFRAPDPPRPADPPERQQQVDWAFVVRRVGGAGPAEPLSQADTDWIVAHRGTVPPPPPIRGRRPIEVGAVAGVIHRHAASEDPFRQRFEVVLASPSSCGLPPSPPPSRALVHQPYDPAFPEADPALWPPRSVLRASVQVRGGGFVDRTAFEPADTTALLVPAGPPWAVAEGAIGPGADTGTLTSLAIFGEASWRTARIVASVDPLGGAAGVAAAVAGSPDGAAAVLFVVDQGTASLRVLRREGGAETEIGAAPLPAGLAAPFALEVTAYEDAWEAAVGEERVTLPREPAEQGRLALAVRGAGRIRQLRVEPVDVHRFDLVTSRYADFAAHVASWSGTVPDLPDVAPATDSVADLLASTPVAEVMTRGADRAARQAWFDRWTAELAVALRRDVERLEVSRRVAASATELLLIESPEPLPFSEDVQVELTRIEADTTRTPVATMLLSDAAECRAFLVPVSAAGLPEPLAAGAYEMVWRVSRTRYRSAGSEPEARLEGSAVMALTL
jgi:hypothetical protein